VSMAAVKYSPEFIYYGLYIAQAQYRGLCLGYLLSCLLFLEKFCNYRCSALDAVIPQVETYKKIGFEPATMNQHWQGTPVQLVNFDKVSLKLLDRSLLPELIDYDSQVFSMLRAAFLTEWVAMPESHTLVAVSENKIIGYGVLSRSEEGYHIAPLFADNENIAKALYIGLCNKLNPDNIIHLDTSESNPCAAILARELGLTPTFLTMRMYKGAPPHFDNKKIFALTTLDIG
jgi:hypothetical protein